jgi:hypothetical protein
MYGVTKRHQKYEKLAVSLFDVPTNAAVNKVRVVLVKPDYIVI